MVVLMRPIEAQQAEKQEVGAYEDAALAQKLRALASPVDHGRHGDIDGIHSSEIDDGRHHTFAGYKCPKVIIEIDKAFRCNRATKLDQ